ncbi:MAG TPA: hypothetical protein VHP58_05060 [Alphaproteobacteria bacterium]|nr:hypothetical protein [Alphaproteobacteria bacterium]
MAMHKAKLTCAFMDNEEALEAGESLFGYVAGFWEGVQHPPLKDRLDSKISVDTRNLRLDDDGLHVNIEVARVGDEKTVAQLFYQWWNRAAPTKGLKLAGCVPTLR